MDTMTTAACSGGSGDCTYAIQVMRILGVKTLFLKENFYPPGEGSLYSNMKPLLEVNGFEVLPTPGGNDTWAFEPGLRFSHNLDEWRNMPNRNKTHIILNQHRYFGLPDPTFPFKPWLTVDAVPSGLTPDITLIAVTNRWRDGSPVRWRNVLAKIEGPKYFIGLKVDHERFEKEAGPIVHWVTKDFLEIARSVRDCKEVYCNQGPVMAISQSLGKEYWGEFKPKKTNCMTYMPNEHYL